VGRVDLRDGVDGVGGHAHGLRPFGQAVELHAFFQALGEQRALLEADQPGVVVAEGMLGLEVKFDLEACGLAEQGLLELGQQVIAAVEELERLRQFVDALALGIGQRPGQADHAGFGNQHRGMIAYRARGARVRRLDMTPCARSRPSSTIRRWM
jgi:hypothetical protein